MHLSTINIYPIKSLKGIGLDAAVVEAKGLQFDRRWLLVDADGRFITQRELPQMATVSVELKGAGLLVTTVGGDSLEIEKPFDDHRIKAKVWDSESPAMPYDDVTNEWFSDVLRYDVKLLYMPDDAGRPVNPRFNRGSDQVSFADGYPLLLTTTASMDDLNSRLEMPIGMERFRPNIVVAGSSPFAEDDWLRIKIGETIFRSTKPCARCVITTIDQSKGESAGKEPLKTLAGYRMAKDVMPSRLERLGLDRTAVLFGQNLIVETVDGTIKIGDSVEILETFS